MARHWTFDPNDDNDLLGDGWACSIRRVWEEMQKRSPQLCAVEGAYCLWQWAHCELAGLPGRAVAGPTCMALTGKPVPFEKLEELMSLSDVIIKEITDPPLGGVPFYECHVHQDIREQWALDHVKLHSELSFVMPFGYGHMHTRSKKVKAAVERAKKSVERKFHKYCSKAM